MEQTRIDYLLERALWGIVAAILILGPLATGAVRPQDFVYLIGLTVAGLSVWVLRMWLNPGYRFLWPPINYTVVAFVGYAIWSYTQAPIEYVARQELLRILVYASVFMLVLNNLHRQDATQFMAGVLIVLAMCISVYAIYQFLNKSEKVWHFVRPLGYSGRTSGTYINPNHLCGFLEMVIPLAMAYVLTGRMNPLGRIFVGYAGLVILAAIGMTISRGGWIATAGSLTLLLFVLMFQKGGRLVPIIAAAGVLVAVGLGLFTMAKQADVGSNRLTDHSRAHNVRYMVWPAAVSIWKQNLLFGAGPGHFDHHFPKYRVQDLQLLGRPERAHNDYLNTLADLGIVGAAIIMSAFALLFWGVARGWRFLQRSSGDQSRASNRAAVVLGSTLGIVAILIHSVFDFNMHIPANAITAISLMALISGHLRFASDRYWTTSALWFKALMTLPLLGLIGALAVNGDRLRRETHELVEARAPKKMDAPYLEGLKRAHAIDPKNWKTVYEIGDYYWTLSSEGATGYEDLAKEAIQWFQLSTTLNPFNHNAYLGLGRSYDWLNKHDEAKAQFEKAVELDPNGFNTHAHMGRHYFNTENYVEAKKSFDKSWSLNWTDNPIVKTYAPKLEEKLKAPSP